MSMTCRRCGHSITQRDVDYGVADKDKRQHKETLCKTLDEVYGVKKKW